jgi:hypothetical protein
MGKHGVDEPQLTRRRMFGRPFSQGEGSAGRFHSPNPGTAEATVGCERDYPVHRCSYRKLGQNAGNFGIWRGKVE